MFKQLSICAALLALGTAGVNARQLQQEAALQKLEVPGASFDIVLAMPKSPAAANLDLRSQPDPAVVYLAGGELAMAVDSGLEGMFKDLGALQSPVAIFHVERNGNLREPVAMYVIPKSAEISRMARQSHPEREANTRIVVPGADFDIVVSTSNSQVRTMVNRENQIDPLDLGLWPTQVYMVPKREAVGSAVK